MNRFGRTVFLIICGLLDACGAAPVPRAPHDSIASAAFTTSATASAPAPRDWTRFGFDAGRSSAVIDATGITAANVAALRRTQVQIDGTVDASAIYLHGVRAAGATHDVIFVTTTYGKTLAIDAVSGAILWRFTPTGYDSWAGSRQITNVTPVADPGREFIYSASPGGHIHKLAVADGREVWSTSITKLPTREKIASSLNYYHGKVIAVTGGYIGDAPPYQGHVAILDAASGALLHVWNSLCSDRQELIDPASCGESDSAIWGRAGAVIDTATGDIFVATGNARWDGKTNWGDASIALDSTATRILDNYTPVNTDQLNARDGDLGSTSPALLGGGYVAQGGKDGWIRLVVFGRTRGAAGRRGGEVQMVRTPSGTDLFTAPAVLRTPTATWLFAADNGGTAAWTLTGGKLQEKWKNGNSGTSPVLAGGLLYVYDPGGNIRVYEPETGRQITTLDAGSGHWNSPIVVDGIVVLPEGNANRHATNGVLDIWRSR
jgi:glucose dehydrogenase